MSDRGSNSGSQSLTSSRKEIIEYEDVTPGKSASQAESSVSRASKVARRAAAEVRARTARRRAARELQIAALRDEIVEIEAEGTKEALEVEEEVFQRELRKTGSPSRSSVSEPRGVRSWAPSSSHQSIIPRNLFGEKEGESQVTVAEESRAARPEEPLGLSCATEDTEEGRKNRVEAWIAETMAQEADGKDSERSETIYRDEDVRVRVPKRTSSRAHSTSQQRSNANSATRKIERGPGAGNSGEVKSGRIELSLQSEERNEPGVASREATKRGIRKTRENENSVQRMGGTKPHPSNSEKSKPRPSGRDEPDGLRGITTDHPA